MSHCIRWARCLLKSEAVWEPDGRPELGDGPAAAAASVASLPLSEWSLRTDCDLPSAHHTGKSATREPWNTTVDRLQPLPYPWRPSPRLRGRQSPPIASRCPHRAPSRQSAVLQRGRQAQEAGKHRPRGSALSLSTLTIVCRDRVGPSLRANASVPQLEASGDSC